MSIVIPANYEAMTFAERRAVREEYISRQGGNCQHCGAPLSGAPASLITANRINWKLFPANFLRHPVHLHHCHNTGMTVGAVHALCNAVLWQYHGE